MKLDILAFAAHPDDVELSCSGTIIKHIQQGKKVGVVDLSQGELGTRGSAEIRRKEASVASKIMALSVRENLAMADGFFQNDKAHAEKIIQMLRKYQPEVVFANAVEDRHPDHGRASQLVSEACFYSGLTKIATSLDGKEQKAWRPKAVYHYIQDRYMKPDFVVDVSEFVDQKMEAIKAFASQFHDATSKEPPTPISSSDFFEFIKSRMREYGRVVGVEFGEGFTTERYIGVEDVLSLK